MHTERRPIRHLSMVSGVTATALQRTCLSSTLSKESATDSGSCQCPAIQTSYSRLTLTTWYDKPFLTQNRYNSIIMDTSQTIIEVDGVNHSPLTVDSIQIYSGQRYSVIIAATHPIGNYWLRALPNGGCTSFDGGANSAIFRYLGAPPVEPTTTNSSLHNPLVETNLHPLEDPGAPGGSAPAEISLCLNVTRVNGRFAINGASFHPPNVPVLLQIMSGARAAQDLLPDGNVYTLPRNKTVELIIPGGSAGSPVSPHLSPSSRMFLLD
ncbi:hypothetical protein C0993_006693 [Termitomyces sp. T159_Od127]|nr:hypothetical protein C0993_006693 [Termitomyces sp. T159_Od127]